MAALPAEAASSPADTGGENDAFTAHSDGSCRPRACQTIVLPPSAAPPSEAPGGKPGVENMLEGMRRRLWPQAAWTCAPATRPLGKERVSSEVLTPRHRMPRRPEIIESPRQCARIIAA